MRYKLSGNLTFIHTLIPQYTGVMPASLPILNTEQKINKINRSFIMSTTNNDTSDIKTAADHVDAQQLKQNLQDDKEIDAPESLTKAQQTPFIDEDVRTDK